MVYLAITSLCDLLAMLRITRIFETCTSVLDDAGIEMDSYTWQAQQVIPLANCPFG